MPTLVSRLLLTAMAMGCAACAHATLATTRDTARVQRVPDCPLPLISGGLPATYLRESTVIGPVAIYPARVEYPNFRPDQFAPISGHGVAARYSSIDAAVTVSALGRVTVSIPESEQDHARLLFDRSRFGNAGYRLSDGSLSYTFIGCRSPYTQYQGGFVITKPGCVELQVQTAGNDRVEHGQLRFGTRRCASRSDAGDHPQRRARPISSQGVSVRLPTEWFGKTTILPQGGPPGTGLAWLQASNFSTTHLVRGVDSIEAIGPGQVVITITDSKPTITHVPIRVGPPLTVARATRLPKAETPRGHVVLELDAVIRGRSLTINIDFGSADTVDRLARSVDGLLATLTVKPRSR